MDAAPKGLLLSRLLAVRSHVSREMVALPEVLMANGAGEGLLPTLLRMRVRPCMFPLVVRPHVEDQVSCQVKGQAAFGTPVLGRQAQSGECR
jgi:hypothetical protein